MSTPPPDVAETLVEIHVLVDETLVEKMDRKEIRVVHDWIDTILDVVTEGETDADADVLDRIAGILDALIEFDNLVPIVGPLLEKLSNMAISAAFQWLREALKPNPERRAANQAARFKRRQDRRKRRRDRRD